MTAPVHKNRVKMTVTGTPGTGTITLNAASSGYQSVGSAYGGNATVPFVKVLDGAAWEAYANGVYTHSGTTLTRGTFLSSSTGSPLSLTSAAVVSTDLVAEWGNYLEGAMQAVLPGGRLTLTTGVPVTTSDVTGATTVYYTPYVHDTVPLWDGFRWVPVQFTETSHALGTITSGLEYAVFGYLSSGALALEKAAWGSTTVTFTASTDLVNWTSTPAVNGDMFYFVGGTAPTGLSEYVVYYVVTKATNSFQLALTPGGSAINFTTDGSGTITGKLLNVSLQDGRYCKNGDKTRLYLGAFYTTATTTTEDSDTKRLLSNVYNAVPLRLRRGESTASWTYATNTWRSANNSTSNRLEVMHCLPRVLRAEVDVLATAGSGIINAISVGLNATSVPASDVVSSGYSFASSSANSGARASLKKLALGYHYAQWLEKAISGTATWYGNDATNSEYRGGIYGEALQ